MLTQIRLIKHANYLLQYQTKCDDMCINLIQIFRQMVFHNYFPMHDKVVFFILYLFFMNKLEFLDFFCFY